MLRIKILLAFLLFGTISFAQEKTHQNEPSKNVEKPKKGIFKMSQMYFEKQDILASYFIKGEIVNGFPSYNHSVSVLENKGNLHKWVALKENKALLTKEGYQSILTYINKK